MSLPGRINDSLMREYGVRSDGNGARQRDCEQANTKDADAAEQSLHHSNTQMGTWVQSPFMIRQAGLSRLEERLGITNGNAEVGTAETSDDGKCDSDHAPVAVDERPAGTPGCSLSIVNNLVGKNITDVTLRHQGTNEFAAHQFLNDFLRIAGGALGNFIHGLFPRARENCAEPGGVAKGDEGLATDRGFFARVELQDGPLEAGKIAPQQSKIGLLGNLRNADADTGRGIRKVGFELRDGRIQSLLQHGTEFVIFPPGLHDVMVGEDAVVANDKSRAEEIGANLRCAAFQGVNGIPITILEGPAVGSDSPVAERAPGTPVDERDGDVQETNTGRIGTDHSLGGLGLRFHSPKAASGIVELFSE